MKSTMYSRNLTKEDGFPENIDREKLVVVQITDNQLHNLILYTDKNGNQSNRMLPSSLGNKYAEGIYIITK